ncbi:carbohydrate ABC transporter permease [Hamadaea tsunoensis]|uniref:carbohydrate ABC transporter permease n=1 Tax=Hamadaea tsunoensis TaxID=53368 RepID=UPI0003F86F28|nr:carbohydrate ABC transporter permease [Hamadaea tsunoensis]
MTAEALDAVATKPARAKTSSIKRPAWEEEPTPAGKVGKGILLTFLVLAVAFPMWCVVVTSLSSRKTIDQAGGLVVIPRGFDPGAYVTIFSGGQVARAVWVSLIVAFGGTAISLTTTVLAAYGLSRPGSLFHRPLLFLFLLTYLIYPGLVTKYLVVTQLVHWKNSLWALMVPSAVNAFNLIVIRAFFMNVPAELLDSARIDGAGEFRILTRIMLPLSKAVIAVVGLFYAVGYWNIYFDAVLYIDDNNLQPIQRLLQGYILAGLSPQVGMSGSFSVMPPTLAVKMAVVVVAIIPPMLAYPFVQRHFTKGVITGAIKG